LPQSALSSSWRFKLPTFISNFHAVLFGLVVGVTVHRIIPQKSDIIAKKLASIAFFLLRRILIPVMPVFILGFILKLQHDKALSAVFKDYIAVFTIVIIVIYAYVILLYGAANSFRVKGWLTSMRNMLPALATAISTSSSSTTIPVTFEGSKKNVKERNIADAMVPVIASTNSIGSCFSIIVLVLVIIESFGTRSVTIWEHLVFRSYFLLLKFAAAAPGSDIIVVLGLLEGYLGFSPAMLSLTLILD
jgi:Na+/H+-dicarboxylate symporter